MKLKSNLEVLMLWYFANYEKEQSFRQFLGDDYELPFAEGFIDSSIIEILVKFEHEGILPKQTVSFRENGLVLNAFKKEYEKFLKKWKVDSAIKDRVSKNSFYLSDILALKDSNIVYGNYRKSFYWDIIYLELKSFQYPKVLDNKKAIDVLRRYKQEIKNNYRLTLEGEVVSLEDYLCRVNIVYLALERYLKWVQLPFEKDEEFNLSEVDLGLFMDQEIAMISVLIAEDLGQIDLRRLYVTYAPHRHDHHLTNIVGKLSDGKPKAETAVLYKIWCSKKTKRGSFYIVINDLYNIKIDLRYRDTYAKLLYEVIHNGKYEHKVKPGLDEFMRRACGLATGDKATFSKSVPNIEFVNFLERHGTTVYASENHKVELIPESS